MACLIVALAGATYLSAVSLELVRGVGCADPRCELVISNRWSRWLGLPVSIPALLVYATCLVAPLLAARAGSKRSRRVLWRITIGAAAIAVAGALWFAVVQLAFADGPCAPCWITQVFGGAAGAWIVAFALRSSAGDTQLPLRRRAVGRAASGFAATGLILLGVGQLAARSSPTAAPAPPATNSAPEPVPPPPAVTTSTASAEADAGREPPARLIGLHIGRFVLNANDLPFWGPSHATFPAVGLFDYTDKNSRHARKLLDDAAFEYKVFATVLMPVPLDATCNPNVEKTAPENKNACAYAKLALAVWRAKREAFRAFDNFLFAGAAPPPLAKARQRALELVGKEALERGLEDPWIDRQIEKGIDIHAANNEKGGDPSLPHIMLGRIILRGKQDPVALKDILDEFTHRKSPRLP